MLRVVPIPAKVRDAAHCDLPKPAKITVQAYFRKAAQAAGHEDRHFHDLRHSCASEMTKAKVDLYTVGADWGIRTRGPLPGTLTSPRRFWRMCCGTLASPHHRPKEKPLSAILTIATKWLCHWRRGWDSNPR
ncbi:tyrosine-type recombinase/integrase [Paracidovorax avenae]|uniref:tyrosine-type recombinase/integrase n=1 Tax=Paracidovorax avenae TaxID=80867 RepID=UPI0033919468